MQIKTLNYSSPTKLNKTTTTTKKTKTKQTKQNELTKPEKNKICYLKAKTDYSLCHHIFWV